MLSCLVRIARQVLLTLPPGSAVEVRDYLPIVRRSTYTIALSRSCSYKAIVYYVNIAIRIQLSQEVIIAKLP